jgi:hypothetical protein
MMTRYLAALMTATAVAAGGIWLMWAPAALPDGHRAAPERVDVATGAVLVAVAVAVIAASAIGWRRRLRADGVIPPRRAAARGEPASAEPAPDDLRELLMPLVAALAADGAPPVCAERRPDGTEEAW